jgi:hypothetical protein
MIVTFKYRNHLCLVTLHTHPSAELLQTPEKTPYKW